MFQDDNSDQGDDKDGKLSVLEELRQMALDAMGHKMGDKLGGPDGMKQVSVMAPDQAGLQKGLQLAQHVAGKPGDDNSAMDPNSDAASADGSSDHGSDDDGDFDDMSPQELDDMIQALQVMKQKKMLNG